MHFKRVKDSTKHIMQFINGNLEKSPQKGFEEQHKKYQISDRRY